jgi:uncharacterized protein YndB with AHSA1/START domain
MEKMMTELAILAPVELTLDLKCSADHAFRTFTKQISDWWPVESHSVEEAQKVVFESHVGGRIYEIGSSGKEYLWGTVLAVESPGLLRFTWHPGSDPTLGHSEVEVRISECGKGSRLTLIHRGFENLGERGAEIREQYVPGWQFVAAECFRQTAEA